MIINKYLAYAIIGFYCLVVMAAVYVPLYKKMNSKKGVDQQVVMSTMLLTIFFLFITLWVGINRVLLPMDLFIISQTGKKLQCQKNLYLIRSTDYTFGNGSTKKISSSLYDRKRFKIVINDTDYYLKIITLSYTNKFLERLHHPETSNRDTLLKPMNIGETTSDIYYCGNNNVPPPEIYTQSFLGEQRGWVKIITETDSTKK